MHNFYCKSNLQYGDCNKRQKLPAVLVEILGQTTPMFLLEIGSQLPYIYLKIHIHDFYCEGRLNGSCRNNKACQNFQFYCDSERTNLRHF